MSKNTEYRSLRIGIGTGIGTGISTRGFFFFATSIATSTFYDTRTILIIMHLLTEKDQ